MLHDLDGWQWLVLALCGALCIALTLRHVGMRVEGIERNRGAMSVLLGALAVLVLVVRPARRSGDARGALRDDDTSATRENGLRKLRSNSGENDDEIERIELERARVQARFRGSEPDDDGDDALRTLREGAKRDNITSD